MKKVLFLIRGVPGSGKSTLAEALDIRAVCCADDYFVHDGKYLWNTDKLYAAHCWCERKCRRFMKKQISIIAIANTFTSARELRPYMKLAQNFNYKVFSIIVENRMSTKNIHSVPDETIQKMISRFEISL